MGSWRAGIVCSLQRARPAAARRAYGARGWLVGRRPALAGQAAPGLHPPSSAPPAASSSRAAAPPLTQYNIALTAAPAPSRFDPGQAGRHHLGSMHGSAGLSWRPCCDLASPGAAVVGLLAAIMSSCRANYRPPAAAHCDLNCAAGAPAACPAAVHTAGPTGIKLTAIIRQALLRAGRTCLRRGPKNSTYTTALLEHALC
jgi:hypothetical protein